MANVNKTLTNILTLTNDIKETSRIIEVTFGLNGSNVLINNKDYITYVNDGQVIVNHIFKQKPCIGNLILKNIVNYIDDYIGDGTSQTIILVSSLLNNICNLLQDDISLITIKKYLQKSLNKINEIINNLKEEITIFDLDKVITSSTNIDSIKSLIYDAFSITKGYGKITINSTFGIDKYIVEKGYSINIPKSLNLNTNFYKISIFENYQNININTLENNLIIIKDYNDTKIIDNTIITSIDANNQDKLDIYHDLEYLIKSNTLISIEFNNKTITLKDVASTELFDELKNKLINCNSFVKKDNILKRLGMITNGNISIYVSGSTNEEIYTKYKQLEDAINSCQNALNYGVVSAGGFVYYQIYLKFQGEFYNLISDSFLKIVKVLLKNNYIDVLNTLHKFNNNTYFDFDTNTIKDISLIYAKDAYINIYTIINVVINNICLILDTKEFI